jgi:hypothetical protein
MEQKLNGTLLLIHLRTLHEKIDGTQNTEMLGQCLHFHSLVSLICKILDHFRKIIFFNEVFLKYFYLKIY